MDRLWKIFIYRFQTKRIRQLPWGVLTILISLALVSFIWSIIQTSDWAGAALNFSTEMAGAVVTYLLLEIVLGSKQRKQHLIAQMGSSVNEIAIVAVEELRRNRWLFDGSLKNAVIGLGELSGLAGAANLRGANLKSAMMNGVYLFVANLEGANLTDAKLVNANLNGANLKDANFYDASLDGAEFVDADLQGASLSRAYLGGAELHGAKLQGAMLDCYGLDKANLEAAQYDSQTIWPEGFDPVVAGAILVEEESKEEPNE